MRMHAFHRTELLLGQEGYARVAGASVCVVGVGGVGSYVVEALARSGVRHLTLVDFDRVCLTNLNRQLHAMRDTVGGVKSELMAERVRAIHPGCDVRAVRAFYGPDTRGEILDRPYDAVVDAIDHMATKLDLLETCRRRGLPVFSAMGAGSRLDPTAVRVTDISATRHDPFARLVRKGLRARGVDRGVVAVWSEEPAQPLDEVVESGFRCICPDRANSPQSCDRRFQVQGTVAWMPAVFGLTLAGAVTSWLAGRPLQGVVPDTTPLGEAAPVATPAQPGLAAALPVRSRAGQVPVPRNLSDSSANRKLNVVSEP